jgi:hypothetical protein
MSDPYRIADPDTTSAPSRGGMLRPVLWLLLIISAVANATVNTAGGNVLVGIGFGLVTLACAATLVVHHYRHRAR